MATIWKELKKGKIPLCWLFRKYGKKVPKWLKWIIGDPATIFEDNFNSYNDGDLNGQGSWVKVSGLVSVQGDTVFEGAKAVSTKDLRVYTKAGTLGNDGRATVYLQASGEGEAKSYIAFCLQEGATENIVIGLSITGLATIDYVTSPPAWVNWSTYTANTWFCLEIEWRSSDHKFRMRKDGGTWSDWFAAYNNWTNGLDTIAIKGYGSVLQYLDYIAENPYQETQDATVTPSAQELALSQPAPTITATKSVTVAVAALALAASLLAPSVTATKSIIVTPSALGLELVQQSPDITTTKSITITPSTQGLAIDQPVPVIEAEKNITVEPSAQTLALTQHTPDISVSVIVEPDIQVLEADQKAPTIEAEKNITVEPSALVLELTQPAPVISISPTVELSALGLALEQPSPTISIGLVIEPIAQGLALSQQDITIDIFQKITKIPKSAPAGLTGISKGIGTLTGVSKGTAIRPYFRIQEYVHLKALRLLEDGGKRLMEDAQADDTGIVKGSGNLTNISKSSSNLIKIPKS